MKNFRSGMVCLLGRPNVGKSTLLNRLLGEHVAIVSRHPHTTRHRLLGVRHGEGYQLVFADTPGMRVKAGSRLEQGMGAALRLAAREADIQVLVVDALRPLREEQQAVEELAGGHAGCVLGVVNKIDAASELQQQRCRERLLSLGFVEQVLLVSGLRGEGVEELERRLVAHLPQGPPWFPEGQVSDQSERVRLAELIREQLLRFVRDELPHQTAVSVEHCEVGASLVRVAARIYTLRDSQKAMVVGRQGKMIAKVGKQARLALQQHFGCKVYLELQVSSQPHWIDRPDFLRELK